ncbi:expressed unknown protein [Seminavis robusta]|uniref:TLC domain-containing protein n=1 Tax=Seminavis robusta TaxID=568900 RepID=A0A9N8EYD6_9STRA|nr:expressed unknown protein [Seminavis robusta]|eukprot:Sro1973_g308640.1 n/a (232) ;mRNA; r:2348-3043
MASNAALLWQDVNSEESWKPLIYPFIFWASSYLYCQLPPTRRRRQDKTLEWHEWHALHNLHNAGAILLALGSLLLHDDTILNERFGILFSLSYFLVDLVDTTTRLDGPYILHAVMVLVLATFNYTTPLHRQLRMNSKAALLETSTPFLYHAKQTRNPIHFCLFAIVFTLCRIIWLPIMMLQLRDHDLPWNDIRLIIVMAFYALNLFWYAKILRIIITEGINLIQARKTKTQ